MKKKKWKNQKDTTISTAHLCIPNEVDSNFAVFDVYLLSKSTPKLVLHVDQQVHHNCFVEKGPLVTSANKTGEYIYKAHNIWSLYTVHRNPFVLKINKSRGDLLPLPKPVCSYQMIFI